MKLRVGIAGTMVMIAALALSVSAYSTQIRAPAVIFGQDAGILTTVNLNVTAGNGTVSIKGPQIVNSSTLQSAQTAAAYASSFAGVNEDNYDFIYTIYNATNVSGPSGGLAMTLLAIAALQHRQLPTNFTATGTISSDGSVGQIGGVTDKSQAAAAGKLSYILVPSAPAGSYENELYYISQQQFHIPLIEVSNASQALGYVYGTLSLPPVSLNITSQYYQSSLPTANITCVSCNLSQFAQIEEFTLNNTNSTINSLGPQYSNLRAQMLSQEGVYAQIAQKGYLYSASDLSFLLYGTVYTFLNSANLTAASAGLLVSNVSSYCSSLTPPPLTNLNYEYVIGGELRQSWGSIYTVMAQQQVNSSTSTDDLVLAVTDAGRSAGWCKAAAQMYEIASSSGGQYVSLSPTVKANATKALNAIAGYGSSTLYYQSADNLYKAGDYAASIYASSYAQAFYGGQPESPSALFDNISSYNYGAWPTEFALQAQFYMNEARLTGNQSENSSAYAVALLAKYLSSDDQQIVNSFAYNVTGPASTGAESTQITQLSEEVSLLQLQLQEMYELMLGLLAILFVILVLFLFYIASPKPKGTAAHGRARHGR